MKDFIDFLKQEGISADLLQEVQAFSGSQIIPDELKSRIPSPHFYYYGKKV